MNRFAKLSAMIVVLSFMLIQGCKKDVNKVPNPIVGNWEWIITYGGGYAMYPTVTPDSVGFNLSYKFDKDSLVQLYLDSSVYRAGKYSIATIDFGDGIIFSELTFKWTTPPQIRNIYMEKIIGTCRTANYQIHNDTIVINYSECDIRNGKREMFIRKQE